MKASGKLLKSFESTLEELEEEYEYIDYIPPPPLAFVWKQFWKIRRTKPFEHPINHTDLYHSQELLKMKWKIWEVDIILKWDLEYYYYYEQYKEKR